LFQALEFLQSRPVPVPALASGFGGKSSTQRRFEMIANPKVNHRLSWWNYLLLLAALAALPFWPGLSSAEEIALGDCPAAVQTTLQALQGAGQIIKIERDADGEEQFYAAELAINGKVYDVRVSGQGTLQSTVYSRLADQANPSITLTFNGSELVGEISESPLGIATLTDENVDARVQGELVQDQEVVLGEGANGELYLRIITAEEQAYADEASVREEVRWRRMVEDQAAHVQQLEAEIERLMEQLKRLEAEAAQNQHQPQAQVQQLEAAQQQADMQAEIVLQERLLRELMAQQQQLAQDQQQHAQQQQQQAEQALAQQRLAGGLPEAIRNTLEREAAGGGIL
jgi:hypothetical protein